MLKRRLNRKGGLRRHAVEEEVVTPRPQARNKKNGSRSMSCLFLRLETTVLALDWIPIINNGRAPP